MKRPGNPMYYFRRVSPLSELLLRDVQNQRNLGLSCRQLFFLKLDSLGIEFGCDGGGRNEALAV